MALEDITLHIDALGKDLDAVDILVESIVLDAGSNADVSVGTYRMGGFTKITATADGNMTEEYLGEEVPTECIVHIAGVPRALASHIREELEAVFLILDSDFSCHEEDPATMEDEEFLDEQWLDNTEI